MANSKIKVRVAPSPTGFLHVGTAQSALFNYLFARKNGGEFHVRIEDTDEERSTKEFEEDILTGFQWLGLDYDGEVTRSSDNKTRYRANLEKLLNSGKAFWCNHSKEELEDEQKMQIERKAPPRHICSHKKDRLESGQVIRLYVNENSDREIIFDDLIRGQVKFKESLLGDIGIARNLDSALYHFAVVIDDIEMKISHVLRGEDHLSNTPKHILIYEALGGKIPEFAHLPLILAPDRSKLSKRHGAVAVVDYKKDYLPEAILNYLGLLSWTPSKTKISQPVTPRPSLRSINREIMSKENMIRIFELRDIHKSGAVFDVKKLNWVNSQWIKNLNADEFKIVVGMDNLPDKAVPLIIERLEKLSDVRDFDYFWKEPEYDKELLKWKNFSLEDVKNSLEKVKKVIEGFDFKNKDNLRNKLDNLAKEIGDRGLVYWPLRVALTGKDKSPDPVEIAFVLGKNEILKRIGRAIILLL